MKGMISPSVMCADLLHLEKSLRAFEELEIEYLHIDIMDGSFVPNFALGTDYVRKLKEATYIPVDIHLMIDCPEDKLEWFGFGDGDFVSFHYEATDHVHRTIQRIKLCGGKPMLALNPATPLCVLENLITDLEGVLIMTVNPGFTGQRLITQTVDKVRRLRRLYPEIMIEVDGNVSFENARILKSAGANLFVAGSSSIFAKNDSLIHNIGKLRERID